MCGICGVVGPLSGGRNIERATDLLRHRGPDDAGYFRSGLACFGMRRLAVIDVAGGSQPKSDESGRFHLVFNGEIYNFRELRNELRSLGTRIRSDSDTEVIVHAYARWGAECFTRLHGMFALALWDADRDELVLARDHLGIKPLFYAPTAQGIVFGSELKAVTALLPNIPAIDTVSMVQYLRYQYVPAPRSILEGVYKLPPGTIVVARAPAYVPTTQAFWKTTDHGSGIYDDRDAEARVDQAIRNAVARQLVSDVPLGAFLSGGVDSSMVVAAMQASSASTVKTFSIGFADAAQDESMHAAEVARHLGTAHHAWTITEREAMAVIPALPRYFDEPFGDSSAIPTFLVSQLARSHVTVSLSGDGGDELFGGYERYSWMRTLHPWRAMPAMLRRPAMATTMRSLPTIGKGSPRVASALGGIADVLRADSTSDAYRNLVAITRDSTLAELTMASRDNLRALPDWPADLFRTHGLDEAMMLADLATYLPDDILTKVDRASMAHSLEARVPLLDLEVVELALSLSPGVRMRHGPKSLLKDVLKRYLPAELVDRPKHGFSIPLHLWIRGPLREQIEDILSPDALSSHGLLASTAVHSIVREHMDGSRNWGHVVWSLVMLQQWHAEMYERLPSAAA